MTHRNVIADDGQGNRTVEVDQTGAWRFLCFRGNFTVRMVVEQRKHDRTVGGGWAGSRGQPSACGMEFKTWRRQNRDNLPSARLRAAAGKAPS